jgi:hypothetical protein
MFPMASSLGSRISLNKLDERFRTTHFAAFMSAVSAASKRGRRELRDGRRKTSSFPEKAKFTRRRAALSARGLPLPPSEGLKRASVPRVYLNPPQTLLKRDGRDRGS